MNLYGMFAIPIGRISTNVSIDNIKNVCRPDLIFLEDPRTPSLFVRWTARIM